MQPCEPGSRWRRLAPSLQSGVDRYIGPRDVDYPAISGREGRATGGPSLQPPWRSLTGGGAGVETPTGTNRKHPTKVYGRIFELRNAGSSIHTFTLIVDGSDLRRHCC